MHSKNRILGMAVCLALGCAGPAVAETCTLKNIDTSQSSRLVRVYDEDTGRLVWSGNSRGGTTIPVPVSGTRARFEYKYPQDRDYHSNTGFWCKNGESTNF